MTDAHEKILSRLRDERDREPRAARCARRIETRSPPHFYAMREGGYTSDKATVNRPYRRGRHG
jgi:hypothetical protein